MTTLRALVRDESGATAVEYGLMLAAITGVIIAIVLSVGIKVEGLFVSADSIFP